MTQPVYAFFHSDDPQVTSYIYISVTPSEELLNIYILEWRFGPKHDRLLSSVHIQYASSCEQMS